MGWPDSLAFNAALDRASIVDGRARFREVLHAVNQAHGPALPDRRKTEDILRDLGAEGSPTTRPVTMGPLPSSVRVIAVPGFLEECVSRLAATLTDGLAHLERLGAKTATAPMEGRGGAAHNARALRDFLLALPDGETVILVPMSKGMVDTMEMFALYPETAGRIAAVVSLVGAVWGSPLAHMAPNWLKWIERNLPLPTCKVHQGAAVQSLTPEIRAAFLKTYVPPAGVKVYALLAGVESAGMSQGMMSSFRALERAGGMNDGQMLLADQVPPGSEVLGVLNGDHIAVGLPFNRNPGFIARAVCRHGLDKNAFPREVMLEAAVRRVLEDL